MKYLFHTLAALSCVAVTASAQYTGDPYGAQQPSYQPQYPADPYSGYSQPSGGYSTGYPSSKVYVDPYYGGGGDLYGDILSWSSLEGHYTYNDFNDDLLEGGSGFGINVNVKIATPVYLHFGLERLTSDLPHSQSIDLTRFVAGVGLFWAASPRFHFFIEGGARYDYLSGDAGNLLSFSADEIGFYGRPGVRWAITHRFELAASVLISDMENLDQNLVGVSAYFALFRWLDIAGGVDFGSDSNSYHLGARWRWN